MKHKGCAKMKGLEVQMERLRQLVGRWWEWNRWVVPMIPVGGEWEIKWGKVMRDMLGKAHLVYIFKYSYS